MIKIGQKNKLTILRQTTVGLFLGDNNNEDILLPNKYCPEAYNIDDTLEVFVYHDKSNRKIATTLIPTLSLHEFALLKVKATTDVGAFLDWGLEKDLFVPFLEQKQVFEEGRSYIVYLDIDSKTNRLYGSNRIDRHLQNDVLSIREHEKVEILIRQKTDLGYSVIVNNKHVGLIYNNEIFKELHIGNKLKGFVKKIREENKLDITLQPLGYTNSIDTNIDLVYNKLKSSGGFLPISDKSSPDQISKQFGISKKSFKKAVGALFREHKIDFENNGIKLL